MIQLWVVNLVAPVSELIAYPAFLRFILWSPTDRGLKIRKRSRKYMGRDCTITVIFHLDTETGQTRVKEFKNR